MPYFQITLAEQEVSCHNGNDGGVDLVNTSPRPPFSYRWLQGPEIPTISNIVTPSTRINSTNVWQSFRPTVSGIIGSLELFVEVAATQYSGVIQFWEGVGIGGTLISFHIHFVPASTLGLHTIDLLSAPYVEAGKEYTVTFIPSASDMNVGIDFGGGYTGGFGGGPGMPTGADLVFAVRTIEDTPTNVISTAEDPTGLTPGKYSAVAFDSVGDIGFGGVLLDNPPELFLTLINIQNPANPLTFDGVIDIDIVGGVPPYSFLWSHGPNSQNVSGLGNGTFGVQIRDDRGCMINRDFTLTSSLAVGSMNGCPGKVVEPRLIISEGEDGHFLTILDQDYTRVFHFQIDANGAAPIAEMILGGNNVAGEFIVKGNECRDAICLDGEVASIIAGCEYLDGEILVRDKRNNDIIRLDGANGSIYLGGSNVDGDLRIFTADGDLNAPAANAAFHFDSNAGILNLNGNLIEGGKIVLRKQGNEVLIVNGDRAEIEITNADFAEDFDLLPETEIGHVEPGMVMVFNPEGKLKPCTSTGDNKVAGIISGAGEFKPGIIMDKQKGKGPRQPIALAGKAYCFVETHESAIEAGDLLTTSMIRGHARKAVSPIENIGAIIGKALKGMEKGKTGLLPVKVGLM